MTNGKGLWDSISMTKKLSESTGRRKILKYGYVAVLLVLVAGLVAVRKIAYLAADPVGEKDCPPLVPESAEGEASALVEMEREPMWSQRGGFVNDASCLNKTVVHGVVGVQRVEDIEEALAYAKTHGLKVAIAGVRHSMGGQAFAQNAVVLDMRKFNHMTFDEQEKLLTVQSGATWHEIQNFLHPRFAVKAMQSTDIFTVGGSIAVNAHGMDHQVGSVAKTVRSMRVLLPDGTLKTLSRTENPELFAYVLGGYGMFGVVIDAVIEVTENVVYERGRDVINYKEFPEYFVNKISDPKYGLFYGHLSTSPGSFLKEMIIYTYKETEAEGLEIPELAEVENVALRRAVLNLSKSGGLAKRVKWWAEKYVEPKLEGCHVNRNQALKEGEGCLVSRNEPMHDSVKYLQNNLKDETDILHEYFIPRAKFVEYVDGMREVLVRNKANLLNASVRVVHKEEVALSYAPEEMFSVVLYVNQKVDAEGNARMETLTRELIDLTQYVGGRFFLPYQLHYSEEQLVKAYPEIGKFWEMKRKVDPEEMLTSRWYEKYGRKEF